jgi:hypothetical protein
MREARATVSADGRTPGLSPAETLELLALGEVIVRKIGYTRPAMVRAARVAGASWTHVGAALGTSKQAAWEAYHGWIEEQANAESR